MMSIAPFPGYGVANLSLLLLLTLLLVHLFLQESSMSIFILTAGGRSSLCSLSSWWAWSHLRLVDVFVSSWSLGHAKMMSVSGDSICCGTKKGSLTLLTACMLSLYWEIPSAAPVPLIALRVSSMPSSSEQYDVE